MRYLGHAAVAALLLCALCWLAGCSASTGEAENTLVITPARAYLIPGGRQTFTANMPVHWYVVEEGGGTITPSGEYTAPYHASTFHILARSIADSTVTRTAEVHVAWDRQDSGR